MYKFLVGSQLLGLSNAKDTDYYVILEEGETAKDAGVDDNHIVDYDKTYQTLIFVDDSINSIYNYQYDKQINPSFAEFFEYSILNYKTDLINLLDKIIANKQFNFSKQITQGNNCCCKIIYHIAYNIFILENNSPIISAEQKQIIQKIHDKAMPIEYLDTLKNKFYQIKEAYYGN